MREYKVATDRGEYVTITVPDDTEVTQLHITSENKQVRLYLTTNQPDQKEGM
jgi:hypothetical protein